MQQLENKTALVIGGTTGIGLATAHRFVAEGAHAFITGRRQAELDQAAEDLGVNATPVRGDVSDLDDLTRIFDAIAEGGGDWTCSSPTQASERTPAWRS